MDFSLERAKATAIKNMNFSNDSREDLASMAEELYEKYDEIEELKKQIEKLNAENEKLKEDVVNKDIRWGLVGCKINYGWLLNVATERYDEDKGYDFNKGPFTIFPSRKTKGKNYQFFIRKDFK